MRILHVIDPRSPGGRACTLNLLASVASRLSECDHYVLIFGTGQDVRTAQACGVEVHGCIPLPRTLPWLGRKPLRQLMRQMREASCGWDLVHAWTLHSAALAALASTGSPALATLHVGCGADLASRYAQRVLYRTPMPLLASTSAVRREHRSAGLPHQWLALFPPAVDPSYLSHGQRAALRNQWARQNQMRLDDDVFIIALLGEPCESADLWDAVNIVARAALAGRNVKLLAHTTAAHRRQATMLLRDLGLDDLVVLDDAASRPWQVAGAVDAGLMLDSACRCNVASSILPLLWSMAAGLPIVAESSESVREVIEDGESGWLVPARDINAAAERLAQVYDDRSHRQRAGATARTFIADMYDIGEYCQRLKHAYDLRLANRSVRTVQRDGAGGNDETEVSTPAAALQLAAPSRQAS